MQHALSATLLVIVEGARTAIGQAMRRAPHASFPAIHWLHDWLFRSARRLDRILSTPYRPRAPVSPVNRAGGPRARVLPSPPARLTWAGFRRLIGGQEVSAADTQLAHLLRDPDIRALLARDPRAVRLFRGLCRRLGIRRAPDLPAILFPAPTPRGPEPRRPAPTPKLRDPRPIVERTAVCPDTGRRTFVPWTAELAGYRRAMAPLYRHARRAAATKRTA